MFWKKFCTCHPGLYTVSPFFQEFNQRLYTSYNLLSSYGSFPLEFLDTVSLNCSNVGVLLDDLLLNVFVKSCITPSSSTPGMLKSSSSSVLGSGKLSLLS